MTYAFRFGDEVHPNHPLTFGDWKVNSFFSWLINGGDPITTYKSWDDPPSIFPPEQ